MDSRKTVSELKESFLAHTEVSMTTSEVTQVAKIIFSNAVKLQYFQALPRAEINLSFSEILFH